MLSMRPKQRPGEKEASFVLYLQFHDRWTMVSVVSSQKEQESTFFTPILWRTSLVAIRLWRNLVLFQLCTENEGDKYFPN